MTEVAPENSLVKYSKRYSDRDIQIRDKNINARNTLEFIMKVHKIKFLQGFGFSTLGYY